MLRLLILTLGQSVLSLAGVQDSFYDCQMRQLALDYTREVVLKPWGSSQRSNRALSLVSTGLRSDQCNITLGLPRAASFANLSGPEAPAAQSVLYVATDGDDSAAGTQAAPLKTIAGAQAKIRSLFPSVGSRPAITVLVQPGEYYFGAAGSDHLAKGTSYSGTSIVRFTEADSGSSPATPITYAAAQPADMPRFIGGVQLAGLAWEPAGGDFPASVLKTIVPGNVSFDVQDQLFIAGANEKFLPLVRARTPNGRPWLPQDGFNLSVAKSLGQLTQPQVLTACEEPTPKPGPGPTPGPLPPRPAAPTAGQCVAAANFSLLKGYPNIPGVMLASQSAATAADCQALCKANPCCKGYTWHDSTTGSYAHDCYILTDPNTDAWMTAEPFSHHFSGLCNHSNIEPAPDCTAPTPKSPCVKATVVCAETNATQVTGSLGISSPSGKALAGKAGRVEVKQCLEHLLDLANDWPDWASTSYGLAGPCNGSSPDLDCANTLDTTYNFPKWFGPWASGIEVNAAQESGSRVPISDYKWPDPSQVVVHAMADGEWGGTQFRVKAASKSGSSGNPLLTFTHGGYQQARGAMLHRTGTTGMHGNRFYMEGSVEFLDDQGEWHFDPASRELYLFPPAELASAVGSAAAGGVLQGTSLMLTQTDTLFEFLGSSSDAGRRVENIVVANLSLSHTSAQFFRPHEETSGGDYATHRSGAIKVENATKLSFVGNDFQWIGGNAIFLSNSVRNTSVTANGFRFLGTSGVAVQGKTGAAMMDGRDGERMMSVHGPSADNGVRLPTHNLVANNVFAELGVWDKQCACYHKALAPGNMFRNNVCFNTSRHAVNFQDGFGGGGIAEGNVAFNLNRETSDTAAFNSWNRRNYITSDPDDPAVGILYPPPSYNEWRRNLILVRDYAGVKDGYGDGLRNDDGASFYKHSNNVLFQGGNGIQFNGGTNIFAHNNLFIRTSWHLGPTPDVAGAFNNTYVDSLGTFNGNCAGFWTPNSKKGAKPGIYTGDFALGVANSTGQESHPDMSKFFCGFSLEDWQQHTGGQDMHSRTAINTHGEFGSEVWLAKAREMLFAGQQQQAAASQ